MEEAHKTVSAVTSFFMQNSGWIVLGVIGVVLIITLCFLCYVLFFASKATPLGKKPIVEKHEPAKQHDEPHKAGHDDKKAHSGGHGHGGFGSLLKTGFSLIGVLVVTSIVFVAIGGPAWFGRIVEGTVDGIGKAGLRALVGDETVDRREKERGDSVVFVSARTRYILPPAPDFDPLVPNTDPDSNCAKDSTEVQTVTAGQTLVPIRPPEGMRNAIFCSEGTTYADIEGGRVQMYAFADGTYTACADSGTVWCEQRSEILGLRSGVEGEEVTVTFRWSKSRKDKTPNKVEEPLVPPPHPPEESLVATLDDLS